MDLNSSKSAPAPQVEKEVFLAISGTIILNAYCWAVPQPCVPLLIFRLRHQPLDSRKSSKCPQVLRPIYQPESNVGQKCTLISQPRGKMAHRLVYSWYCSSIIVSRKKLVNSVGSFDNLFGPQSPELVIFNFSLPEESWNSHPFAGAWDCTFHAWLQ